MVGVVVVVGVFSLASSVADDPPILQAECVDAFNNLFRRNKINK